MNGIPLALALTMLAGVSLGALGSGGSILALPILVYVAGIAAKPAVGMSMAIVGATSLVGFVLHWRRGNVALRPALWFSLAGIPGSYIGALGTHLVPAPALLGAFATLMAVVGVRMLRARRTDCAATPPAPGPRCLSVGFGVGLLTGFLGVGGGFLIVPALVWLACLDTKRAMGTSLGIIAANSAAGIAGQLRYIDADWLLASKFLAFSLLGMALGLAVSSRTPERGLRRAFGALVLCVAAWMAVRIVRG